LGEEVREGLCFGLAFLTGSLLGSHNLFVATLLTHNLFVAALLIIALGARFYLAALLTAVCGQDCLVFVFPPATPFTAAFELR
jgi:hypothetical protein